MKTANEMYQYCTDNGYGSGFTKKWALKHFTVVESNLMPGEEVLMSFIGIHDYASPTSHAGNFAYTLTNKRLLAGQKKIIGENANSVYLNTLNDVQLKTGAVYGVVTFDTIKETFSIALLKGEAKNIFNKIQDVIHSIA